MSNTETAAGNWNQVKGKIQERWGDVTNDDLDKFKGRRDQVIGMIQEKTGVAKEEIEKYINSISESAAEFSKHATEVAREYRDAAAETAANVKASAGKVAGQIGEQAQAGYEEAQRVVRERPAQSLAMCFGVGIVVGVLGGLVLRSR